MNDEQFHQHVDALLQKLNRQEYDAQQRQLQNAESNITKQLSEEQKEQLRGDLDLVMELVMSAITVCFNEVFSTPKDTEGRQRLVNRLVALGRLVGTFNGMKRSLDGGQPNG